MAHLRGERRELLVGSGQLVREATQLQYVDDLMGQTSSAALCSARSPPGLSSNTHRVPIAMPSGVTRGLDA
ncbi:hypothetical protein AB2L57_13905 [Microbacterium sp. HA-8]|uniref:hypothetical protein n=1 Tax=Microbacterium sp. HA-8 TaxID=3234200 RepID=UPI0038F63CB4